MPRTEGSCGPVVVATTGIELPDASRIDFAAIRARVAEQRRHGPCQHRTTPDRTVAAQSGGRRAGAGRASVRVVA